MDPPTDSKKNNTSSSSDVNLGIFKAGVEYQIMILQELLSRKIIAMRDEYEDKIKLLQSRLTGLQRVAAMQLDDSRAQRLQTKGDLEKIEMEIKSIWGFVIELARSCTQSERQRNDRAWGSDDVPASDPTQCQPFNNFGQRKKKMLATHGIVKTRQKKMMLQIWRAKRGSNGNPMQALLLKMSRFLKRNVISLDLSVDELFDLAIDQIPDYDWLKFARTELGLMESEIRKVKQTCEPTEEQLYQLSLEGGAVD